MKKVNIKIISYYILFFIYFLIFSLIKLNPDILAYKFFHFHEYGNLDRYVVNIINEISIRELTGKNEYLPLWQSINPGIFYLVSKIFYNLGNNNYLYPQLLNILFHFFGIIFFYFNIKILFDKYISLISTTIYLFSPFFIAFSGTIHEPILNFFFLNLFIFFFINNYKKLDFKKFIIALTLIFLCCSNYWINYIFIQIFLFYFLVIKEKFNLQTKYIIIQLVPISTLFFYIILSSEFFSFSIFLEKLLGRTYDIRLGTNFLGFEKVLTFKNFILYPAYLDHRIRTMMNIGLLEIIILYSLIYFYKINIKNLTLIKIFLLCSLTWYIFFPQHTIIHRYSGQYSYFGIIISYTIFIYKIFEHLIIKKNYNKNLFLSFAAVIILMFYTYNTSTYIFKYSSNIFMAKWHIKNEIYNVCNKEIKSKGDLNLINYLSKANISNDYNFKIYKILGIKKFCK